MLRSFLIVPFVIIFSTAALPLKERDVKASMEEMLAYHVEYKQLEPVLAKRALKIFIEQFDPERVYLLVGETQSYLSPTEERLRLIIDNYRMGNLSEWQQLHDLFRRAVTRARAIRQEIARELLQSKELLETAMPTGYSNYAGDTNDLRARIRKQLTQRLFLEQSFEKPPFSQEKMKKIFALLERRYARFEDTYLGGAAAQRYISMHLLKALAKSLDAHTAYFSPEEARDMRTLLEKQFEGIGVVLREGIDGVVIQDTVKGGPAKKSGKIAAGDVIVGIDGESVEKSSYEEILKKLQGNGQKKIELTLRRADSKGKPSLHKVSLLREKIVMEEDRVQYTFEPFAHGIIGKIILPSFYEGGGGSSCEADIREALRALKRRGPPRPRAHMRDNSGGFLSQAVKVAGLFVSSGVIVVSKYAQGEIQYLRDLDGRSYYSGPLIVLTSKASASAAEIVAQALQDYGTALIVGDERTYGKGTIQYQTVTDPQASSFFKVTVGRYYTVSGRSTQIEGVIADIVVPTLYSAFNMGERYLEYPLKSDRIPSVYVDPLTDVDQKHHKWFQQNYLPNLQKKLSLWTQMLPRLKQNSSYRLQQHDKDYTFFLNALGAEKKGQKVTLTAQNNFGVDDLQMIESVNLLKDMILIHKK